MDVEEVGELDAVDGDDLGAVTLGSEAEPAVPCAYVENALAVEVVRDREAPVAAVEDLESVVPLEAGPVGQFEAVVPALIGEFLTEVPAAAGWARWSHQDDCR